MHIDFVIFYYMFLLYILTMFRLEYWFTKSKKGVASLFARRSLFHLYLSVNQYSYLMTAEQTAETCSRTE
jgi:hypothetical protein